MPHSNRSSRLYRYDAWRFVATSPAFAFRFLNLGHRAHSSPDGLRGRYEVHPSPRRVDQTNPHPSAGPRAGSRRHCEPRPASLPPRSAPTSRPRIRRTGTMPSYCSPSPKATNAPAPISPPPRRRIHRHQVPASNSSRSRTKQRAMSSASRSIVIASRSRAEHPRARRRHPRGIGRRLRRRPPTAAPGDRSGRDIAGSAR